MPTYEYKCNDCERRFEQYQSIKAGPLTDCDECGGGVERLISAGGGLLFKGSGFYTTDYRSDSYKAKAKSESSDSSTTSESSGSSSGSDKSGSTKANTTS